MTTIINQSGIWTGTNEDGRIVYRSCDDGPCIAGRDAWRGFYLKSEGTYTIQEGSLDSNSPVDTDDWKAACALMGEVDMAVENDREATRQRAETRLDEMANAIPDQMIDFHRSDSDL